jgi:hypothetical protein
MPRAGGTYRQLVPKVAAPAIATIVAWANVQILLLSETEFRFFDDGHAPEDSARRIRIAKVTTLNLIAAAMSSPIESQPHPWESLW